MKHKKITIKEIIDFLGKDIIAIDGEINGKYIDNLADVANSNVTTLDWVSSSKKEKQVIAESSRAVVLLVDNSIAPIEGKVLIHVKCPKTALAKVGNEFFVEKPEPGIHPSAIIDKDAEIGDGVYIGPYCVIGKAKIGANTAIESFVRIYDDVEIGDYCHIFDNVVIGAPGFGWQKDDEGNRLRFPQLGKVIIGDHVDIGCLTCVDRGALSNTIIGDYTKIDSGCKIAHNNLIGNNVVITGGNCIAGSNEIEDDVWIGPNCSLKEWGHIGKGAFIGIGSVVVTNIKEGTRVFGNPAKKIVL